MSRPILVNLTEWPVHLPGESLVPDPDRQPVCLAADGRPAVGFEVFEPIGLAHLPDPSEGEIFIVPPECLGYAKERSDIVAPPPNCWNGAGYVTPSLFVANTWQPRVAVVSGGATSDLETARDVDVFVSYSLFDRTLLEPIRETYRERVGPIDLDVHRSHLVLDDGGWVIPIPLAGTTDPSEPRVVLAQTTPWPIRVETVINQQSGTLHALARGRAGHVARCEMRFGVFHGFPEFTEVDRNERALLWPTSVRAWRNAARHVQNWARIPRPLDEMRCLVELDAELMQLLECRVDGRASRFENRGSITGLYEWREVNRSRTFKTLEELVTWYLGA